MKLKQVLMDPPLGLNRFVIRGVAPEVPLRDIMLGSLPFVGIMLGFIVLEPAIQRGSDDQPCP